MKTTFAFIVAVALSLSYLIAPVSAQGPVQAQDSKSSNAVALTAKPAALSAQIQQIQQIQQKEVMLSARVADMRTQIQQVQQKQVEPSTGMPELMKIVLTSCFTVLGGVIILVVGQMVTKFVVEPIRDQRDLIAKIDCDIQFYADLEGGLTRRYRSTVETTDDEGERDAYLQAIIDHREKVEEASTTYRKYAIQLRASKRTIAMYRLWMKLNLVPTYEEIRVATNSLIEMSALIDFSNGDLVATKRCKVQESLKL